MGQKTGIMEGTAFLVVRGKYNKAAIMRKAQRMAKSCYDGNIARGLKAAWKAAKREMAELKELEAEPHYQWNPYVTPSMLYTSSNMINGYATR